MVSNGGATLAKLPLGWILGIAGLLCLVLA